MQIAGREIVAYEVTGEAKGVKFQYRILMFVAGDYFYKLACWTTPDHWAAAKPKFEELIGHLK